MWSLGWALHQETYCIFIPRQSYYRQKTSPFASQRTHRTTNKNVSYYKITDKSISPSLPLLPFIPSFFPPSSLPFPCPRYISQDFLFYNLCVLRPALCIACLLNCLIVWFIQTLTSNLHPKKNSLCNDFLHYQWW